MRVFVTGASGWIGSATVDELLSNGHEVVGLVRSEAAAATLEAKGATALRGDLDDLAALRKGSDDAEAVVHLSNKHDWSDPAESNRAERTAVETIADVLVGSDRPFLFAAGVAGLVPGRASTERDRSPFSGPDAPRGGAENLALEYVEKGVRSISLRFAPTVHGEGDHGFVHHLVTGARAAGVSGYVGDGSTGWSAVHRSDAARMVRLGLEQAPAGTLLHAVAEPSVPSRTIAEAIGRGIGVPIAPMTPEEASERLGFLGSFFAMDLSATSTITQELLGWTPTGPTLLEDLESGEYFRG